MYDNAANFDSNGWLVLGFNGQQPMIADQYTSTGSLYMATLELFAFGFTGIQSFLDRCSCRLDIQKSLEWSAHKKGL